MLSAIAFISNGAIDSAGFYHAGHRFGWDGNVVLHEWDTNEALMPRLVKDETGREEYDGTEKPENLVTWVYDGTSFTPVAKVTEDERYTIVHDYLGTPMQAYDGNGELVWEMMLDVYGRVMDESRGDRALVPFRYQGQYEDVETGLYYNRFRYYSPEMGMYISSDPIGLAGNNPTLYGYVQDVNAWLDVFGLDKFGPNQDVYALYKNSDVIKGIPKEGAVPYYIGISQNSDMRVSQHTYSGRFNPATDTKVVLHEQIDYSTARAYEQYYIEKFETIDRSNPKSNQQNSFRHNRTDERGVAFDLEYNKIKCKT